MPFLIQNINNVTPLAGVKYLFDANVWLDVLDFNFQGHYSKPYVDFFDAVIISKLRPKPLIVLPSLLLSEILGRLLNDIYYREFCYKNPPGKMAKHKHYKDVYRSSSDYILDFTMACKTISDYHYDVELISDNLNAFHLKDLLTNIPIHLDINDHLYVQIARQQELTIVTADKDFAVQDLKIITANPSLLRLR